MLRRSNKNQYTDTATPVNGEWKVKQLYNRYADDIEDAKINITGRIGPNGMARLLEDMQLEPADRKVLVLLYKMQPKAECEFTWDEWHKGLRIMEVDSVDGLRRKLDFLDKGIRDTVLFKEMYQFTFAFVKPVEDGRNMGLATAIPYWGILFKNEWPLLPLWTEYLQAKNKPITKDCWTQLLDFVTNIKCDLTNYDEMEAWPVVIDEFVTWAKPRLAKAGITA